MRWALPGVPVRREDLPLLRLRRSQHLEQGPARTGALRRWRQGWTRWALALSWPGRGWPVRALALGWPRRGWTERAIALGWPNGGSVTMGPRHRSWRPYRSPGVRPLDAGTRSFDTPALRCATEAGIASTPPLRAPARSLPRLPRARAPCPPKPKLAASGYGTPFPVGPMQQVPRRRRSAVETLRCWAHAAGVSGVGPCSPRPTTREGPPRVPSAVETLLGKA
jgi:hypothetical protein